MIVLDTQAVIWWSLAPEKLSKKARKLIEEEQKKGKICISCISTLEVYRLVKKGKVEMMNSAKTWLEKIAGLPFVTFIPIDNTIAADSVDLLDFDHKDPADRIIIATALNLGVRLVTSDKKILNYPHVQSVW